MTQALTKFLTFDEFIEQYPEDGGCYELRNGAIVEMRPIGKHEKVIGFTARKLNVEIDRLQLPYFIPGSCAVKPDRDHFGYLPDIVVLDEAAIEADPYWERYSSISIGASARLIVEVVSTNWQDDYLTKLADYEKLKIPEYWILDYRALGAARYIGSPKVPTVSVYVLDGEEYQVQQFRENEVIESIGFPELRVTAAQVLAV
jgi:Uma2 family endonuclease